MIWKKVVVKKSGKSNKKMLATLSKPCQNTNHLQKVLVKSQIPQQEGRHKKPNLINALFRELFNFPAFISQSRFNFLK